MAFMAITTVLLGAFSIVDIFVGDINSGDTSFTSSSTIVTCGVGRTKERHRLGLLHREGTSDSTL